MRGHEIRRAVFDITKNLKDLHLSFGLPLVFVDVVEHLFDLVQSRLKMSNVFMIRSLFPRLLQDISEQKNDARQPLDGMHEQICQVLPSGLGFALANSEEGVKSRVLLLALQKHLLGILVKVDIRRVSFEQVIRILQIDISNREIVSPVILGMIKFLLIKKRIQWSEYS